MTSDNADDSNMRMQRGICYARANGIIKNFSMCILTILIQKLK